MSYSYIAHHGDVCVTLINKTTFGCSIFTSLLEMSVRLYCCSMLDLIIVFNTITTTTLHSSSHMFIQLGTNCSICVYYLYLVIITPTRIAQYALGRGITLHIESTRPSLDFIQNISSLAIRIFLYNNDIHTFLVSFSATKFYLCLISDLVL